MPAKIQVVYRAIRTFDKDTKVKTRADIATDEKVDFKDVTIEKDSRKYYETEVELKDEKNLLVSGNKYTIFYEAGDRKGEVIATIGDPKGLSMVSIELR